MKMLVLDEHVFCKVTPYQFTQVLLQPTKLYVGGRGRVLAVACLEKILGCPRKLVQ